MTQWTEAAIRQALDGKFYRVLYDGKVAADDVPPDFLPSFKAPPKPPVRKNYRDWTDLDVALLLQFRAERRPISEIADILERTEDSIKKRLSFLNGGNR